MNKLPIDFYLGSDVVQIAKDLLGKVLYTNIDNCITAGIITATEAYAGVTDKASHAYGGRYTERTKTMYNAGGCSYVYLCYGIHHLFNIVTNQKDIPDAVLLRGIQPLEGLDKMCERRKKSKITRTFSSGPGSASEALGIKTLHNNISMLSDTIWVEDHHILVKPEDIRKSTRIGVDYAQEDALREYHFSIRI